VLFRSLPRRSVVVAAAATTALALLGSGDVASAERHKVDLRWKAAGSFTTSEVFVDLMSSRGAPFGRGRVVARTPREQRTALIRTPKFKIRTEHGVIRGHLRVKKTYLQTTATHQLARYRGTGRFDGGTRRYRGATGKIKRLYGIVDCFADGDCEGHLDVTGRVRY
jgi:hypothetical protein